MSLTHQLLLQSLRELSNLDQEKFDAHRMPLVAWLIDHAWKSVPAVREQIASLIEDDSLDLARWSEIPLLGRVDVERLGTALEARDLPPEAGETEETIDLSGAVRRRSRLALIAAECAREWCLEANAIDIAAPLAILHPAQRAPDEGLGWSITFSKSRWIAGDPHADPAVQLRWLADSGTRLLKTDGAIAHGLVRLCEREQCRLPVEAIIVSDAHLGSKQRARIEDGAGVPVTHLVEDDDLGIVAASDPSGGYIVPAATAVIEVVDATGRPVTDRSVGEVVVTPLYEYAAPRLRLATGLMAIADPYPGTLIGVRRLAATLSG